MNNQSAKAMHMKILHIMAKKGEKLKKKFSTKKTLNGDFVHYCYY
jgi:hypothetical protein